jgi:PilZ domain
MGSPVSFETGAARRQPSRPEKAIFRRWQRYRLKLPVRLIVIRDDSTRIVEGRVHDVSEGGVLLFAGVELRPSDEISVEFTLPYSSTAVRAPGAVRHRRGYNYGIEFRCETPEEQELVAKFRNLMQLAASHDAR